MGYFGASQAHILGGVLAALDPHLSRIVLNVGGGGFTTIMPRSGVNRRAIQQMDAFLKPGGVIVHTCEGPCDPE